MDIKTHVWLYCTLIQIARLLMLYLGGGDGDMIE